MEISGTSDRDLAAPPKVLNTFVACQVTSSALDGVHHRVPSNVHQYMTHLFVDDCYSWRGFGSVLVDAPTRRVDPRR